MVNVKIINNSHQNHIYDKTLQLSNNGRVMFIDIMFDRKANFKLGLDSTQFENDLIEMLKFVTDDNIKIE